MTIRIPLRVVLFILYTAALLGGAAGVAFAVTQTAEGPRGEQGEPGPQGPTGPAGPQGASETGDSRACHNALVTMITATLEAMTLGAQGVGSLPPSLARDIEEAEASFNSYC